MNSSNSVTAYILIQKVRKLKNEKYAHFFLLFGCRAYIYIYTNKQQKEKEKKMHACCLNCRLFYCCYCNTIIFIASNLEYKFSGI